MGEDTRLFICWYSSSWEPEASSLIDIKLLLVQRRIALHDHRLLSHFFHLNQGAAVVRLERFCHIGIHPQHYIRMLQMFRDLAHLQIDFIAHRGHRLHKTGRLAIRTWRADGFFFNVTATTEIYTLSLHDALPIFFPHPPEPPPCPCCANAGR